VKKVRPGLKKKRRHHYWPRLVSFVKTDSSISRRDNCRLRTVDWTR